MILIGFISFIPYVIKWVLNATSFEELGHSTNVLFCAGDRTVLVSEELFHSIQSILHTFCVVILYYTCKEAVYLCGAGSFASYAAFSSLLVGIIFSWLVYAYIIDSPPSIISELVLALALFASFLSFKYFQPQNKLVTVVYAAMFVLCILVLLVLSKSSFVCAPIISIMLYIVHLRKYENTNRLTFSKYFIVFIALSPIILWILLYSIDIFNYKNNPLFSSNPDAKHPISTESTWNALPILLKESFIAQGRSIRGISFNVLSHPCTFTTIYTLVFAAITSIFVLSRIKPSSSSLFHTLASFMLMACVWSIPFGIDLSSTCLHAWTTAGKEGLSLSTDSDGEDDGEVTTTYYDSIPSMALRLLYRSQWDIALIPFAVISIFTGKQ